MKSLVIGNTSQLSYYFPEEFVKISSRNLDYEMINKTSWNRVYVCVGESRKFLNDSEAYEHINFTLTLSIINKIKDNCKKLIVYSSCELWNKYDGQVDLSMDFDFYHTPYLQSKYQLSKFILENKDNYKNVNIVYSFNFNSPHRNNNFLFGKIFDSIINRTRIEIGNTYFYRDIVHPTYVTKQSINTEEDILVGSGRLTFVNDFIRDLYSHYDLKYDKFVIENYDKFNEYDKRKEYYLKSKECMFTYDSLLKETIKDLDIKIEEINGIRC